MLATRTMLPRACLTVTVREAKARAMYLSIADLCNPNKYVALVSSRSLRKHRFPNARTGDTTLDGSDVKLLPDTGPVPNSSDPPSTDTFLSKLARVESSCTTTNCATRMSSDLSLPCSDLGATTTLDCTAAFRGGGSDGATGDGMDT
jgi:hypothetical protein